MIVSMLGSIVGERWLFQNSGNISARVSLTPSQYQYGADAIVDIRELKLLSEFSHPNIVKFVSSLIMPERKRNVLIDSEVFVSLRIIARSRVCSSASYVRTVICSITS